MTIREVVQIGHPALREAARPIDPEELATPAVQAVLDDLVDTMRAAHGAGLAATQIGVPLQACVIEVRPGNPRYPYKPEIPLTILVNPELELLGTERFSNYEGCLSVPDLRGVVDRAVEVRVRALDRDGGGIDRVVRGLSAGTFQHEVDHLQGRLFVDRVADTRTLCTWAEFRLRHEAAFAERVRALVARYGS